MSSSIDATNWVAVCLNFEELRRELISTFDTDILCIWMRNNEGSYSLNEFAYVKLCNLTKIERQFIEKACSLYKDSSFSYNTEQNYLWRFEKEMKMEDYKFLNVDTYKVRYSRRPVEITREKLDLWKVTNAKLDSLRLHLHLNYDFNVVDFFDSVVKSCT